MPGYNKTEVINGRKYTVSRLPFGMQGDPSSMRGCLALIGRLVSSSSQESADALEIIASIISRSDSIEASQILSALGDRTEYFDGKSSIQLSETTQNLHWSDFPSDFFPWIIFALKVNFEDFLKGGSEVLGDQGSDPAKAKEAEKLLKSLAKLTG